MALAGSPRLTRLAAGLLLLAAAVGFRAWPWLPAPAVAVRPAAAAVPGTPAAAVVSPYLGVEACRQCHADKVAGFSQTSHFLAMQPPSAALLGEAFGPAPQQMLTRRDALRYEMSADEQGFHLASIEAFPEGNQRRQRRVDLVMGSGKLGYSFMYWEHGRLYQMPLIYYTPLGQWVNAPGFSDRWPWWDRPVNTRCLDCHATWFDHVAETENEYHPAGAVLPISCERCHGPARQHVAYHQAHPETDEGRSIVAPASLSRQRQLDLCGQCHSEVGQLLAPAFSYLPGTPLADYLRAEGKEETRALVHSVNQLQRLAQSKCFQQSEMTCTSCHNPHLHERDQPGEFSARCLSCHQELSHPLAEDLGDRLRANCIDCHMPRRDDESTPIDVASGDELKLIQLRDHLVAVYPDAAETVAHAWREAAPDDQRATAEPTGSLAETARQRLVRSYLRAAALALAAGAEVRAIALYRAALALDPAGPAALELAWLRAAHPDPQWRDGHEALRLAEAAAARNPSDWQAHDARAAALAELARYPEAVDAAQQALALVSATGEAAAAASEAAAQPPSDAAAPLRLDVLRLPSAGELPARLETYRCGEPYRLPSPRASERPTRPASS